MQLLFATNLQPTPTIYHVSTLCGCRKENVPKTSKWSDQRLTQKSSLLQPAIPVLDIPVDEEIQNKPSPEHVNPVNKVSSAACVLGWPDHPEAPVMTA